MKYLVNFANADPKKIDELSFEQGDKVYRQGDVFEPPANWRVNMNDFQGSGMRFEVPYVIVDEKGREDWSNYRNLILPVSPMEPEAPAEVKAKTKKEG